MIGDGRARLAGRFGLSYLKVMLKPATQRSFARTAAARQQLGSAIAVGSALLLGAMLVAAALLWIRYGTAVFFEMIASGLAACF